ncbi:MAG TPA: polyribonucleotide nucleotidyltransferase [Candidatus Limnocylindrales bacterium]|jgi:DNA polymerase III epsilon subunit family exonuclease|nr:polyribonucleotide nucleotidyltransferase [Candidatus Limnocylindrales bacterium]
MDANDTLEESVAIKHEAEIGGQVFSMEAGKLAEQADGAVIVRLGDTVVLATAVASKEPREGVDFFPLTVDYEERMYAAGKIPGGFIKREARPSEAAILAMRLTDRPIRPLFPKGYHNDVQVVLTVLSTDMENDPDILALNGASAALSMSHIPFLGPVGAVRVGRIDGEFVTNPTNSQLDDSELDLVVAGTREAVMMVEAGAKILPEAIMADAIAYGHAELQKSIDLQEKLVASAGSPKRMPFVAPKADSVVKLAKRLGDGQSEFVVFDLETTAMKPEHGYIVDIAALRVRDGQVVDRFESLVNPGRPIVGHQVHGISTDDVASAPTASEVLGNFAQWVGDAPIVAHNVAFDVPFVLRHLPNDVKWEPSAVFDTLELGYQLYPDAGAWKLGDLVRFVFGRDHAAAHRAMPDAEATAELFLHFTQGLAERIDAVRDDIASEVRRARESYNRSEQGERLEDIRRRHGIGSALMDSLTKSTVRELVLSENVRIDGRDTTTIRPITVEVGVLPRTHGSAIFTRGQTQALSIATLGSASNVQRLDTISPETEKRYLHHYNMPPYSVGEARFMRGPGRREIGHGALAERALLPVLPDMDEFPYVIRVVSEVVSSNGSTSMASTCGSTLALMDAGVPIKSPVAGAAMGLITDPDSGRYAVLTDITGKEDAYGDMDFKVTGTAEGVTALQMDIKVAGITTEIMRDALEQARVARLFILDRMTSVIGASREELSPYAPRITSLKIPVDKIRDVIGAGGKVIRQITAETGTEINVEDDGTIQIAATSGEAAQKAIKWIEGLTKDVEVGKEYLGKVTRIMNFGAFVEILPGKEGLVHISQLADYRVPRVEDVVSIGDELMVVVTEIDRMGRVNLSRRAAMERHMAKSGSSS